jgi:hypothetical protein
MGGIGGGTVSDPAGAATVGRVTSDAASSTAPPVSASAPPTPGIPDDDRTAAGRVGGSPEEVARYRCRACGNLTRFNVVTSSRTRAFHHYSVGGELTVEEVEVLDESVDEVSCRWCGNGSSIEVIGDPSPLGD